MGAHGISEHDMSAHKIGAHGMSAHEISADTRYGCTWDYRTHDMSVHKINYLSYHKIQRIHTATHACR